MTTALIAFLEREGGYNVICLALIALGVCLADHAARPQMARDLVVFATGVLARSMGARKAHEKSDAA